MRLRAAKTTNQVDSRGDVAPLIAAAQLKRARETIVQNEEVIRLQQEVTELRVRDAFVTLAPSLHRLFREHVVHREVLPHVAHELDRAQPGEPFCVVHQSRRSRHIVEVEKPRELRADTRHVRFDLLHRQQRAFRRFAARIADHSCAAADHRDGRMAETLEPRERHHRQEAADVKTRRGRIETDVGCQLLPRDEIAQPLGGVVSEAAPFEFAVQVHQPLLYNRVCSSPGAQRSSA